VGVGRGHAARLEDLDNEDEGDTVGQLVQQAGELDAIARRDAEGPQLTRAAGEDRGVDYGAGSFSKVAVPMTASSAHSVAMQVRALC
jgi:hypothetical protein